MEGPERFTATRGTGPWLSGVEQAASTTWLGLYVPRVSDPFNYPAVHTGTERPC